jgi:hypothetical protein
LPKIFREYLREDTLFIKSSRKRPERDATPRHFVITSTTSAHSTMKFSAIILVAAVMVSLADAFLPAALPRRRAAMARLRMGQVDVTIEKPLGITLEENEADAAKGVFCKLLANPGAAYVSVRTTDCGL